MLPALHCLRAAERVFVLASASAAMPHRVCRRSWRSTASPRSCTRFPSVPVHSARRCSTKAHELGADMLVMGAYQHSPLREFLFGGVTRHMLAHADLPMLLRH